MVNEIVLAIDPALRKIEDILLWKNKFKTAVIFTLFHFLFWLFQNFNIRTYCAISCLIITIHLLDAYRAKKRRELIRMHSNKNIIESLSSLGRWIIYSYSRSYHFYLSLRRLKQRNRYKYFLVMLLFWSLTAIIGVKIKGIYLIYLLFWVIFVIPAVIHYDIPRKILSKAMPILEQLDHSMKYERRSILDKKELLVDVKLPQSDFDDLEQEDEYLKSFQLEDLGLVKSSHRRVFENEPEDEEDEYDDDDDDEEEEEEEEENYEEDDEQGEEIEEEFEYEAKRPASKNNEETNNTNLESISYSSLDNQIINNRINYDLNTADEDDDSLLPVDSTYPNINDVSTSINDNNNKDLDNPKVIKRKTKNRPSLLDYYGDSIKMDTNTIITTTPTTTTTTNNNNNNDNQIRNVSDVTPIIDNNNSVPLNNWKYSSSSRPTSSASSSTYSTTNYTSTTSRDNASINKMMSYARNNNILNDDQNSKSSSNRKSLHNEQDIDETFDFLDEELNKYGTN